MNDVRALILARGLARRMREPDVDVVLGPLQAQAAEAGLKAMMPIEASDGLSGEHEPRPFLDYVISSLADAGYHDVGVVIGPEHDWIRDRYAQDAIPRRVRLSWIVQAEPRGTANAVLAAEAWAGASPFVVVNADNLYPMAVLAAMRALGEPGLPAFERDDLVRSSHILREKVASFALLHADDEGYLTGIVEKPGEAVMDAAGPRALVSMNCWRFDARIFESCRDVPLSPRGELELPLAVGLAMVRGVRFRTVPATGEVIDLSRRADVAQVSTRLAGRTPRL